MQFNICVICLIKKILLYFQYSDLFVCACLPVPSAAFLYSQLMSCWTVREQKYTLPYTQQRHINLKCHG